MTSVSPLPYADTVGPNVVDIEAAMRRRYTMADYCEQDCWLRDDKRQSCMFYKSRIKKISLVNACTVTFKLTNNEVANLTSYVPDLGALMTKAQSLRAQLALAARSARKLRKDRVNSIPRHANEANSWPATNSEPVTNTKVAYGPNEPAFSPHGALICAENWKAIDGRRLRARRNRFSQLVDLIHERHRQATCEQLCKEEADLYQQHFQSLDQALRGTPTANRTTGKLMVIFENVLEESSSEHGTWEDPGSTIADESCSCCEASGEEETGGRRAGCAKQVDISPDEGRAQHIEAIRTVSNDGSSSERSTTVKQLTSSSPEKTSGGQDAACSLGRVLSCSPEAKYGMGKDLDVPDRLLTTPPPPYALSEETTTCNTSHT